MLTESISVAGATDNIWYVGELAHLNLVSVLLFFEENGQITKPMSNRRLLSTTQIKSVARHIWASMFGLNAAEQSAQVKAAPD